MLATVLRRLSVHPVLISVVLLGGALPSAQAQIGLKPVTLTSKHSGKCVNVWGQSPANDAPVLQWTCDDSPNSAWILRARDDAFELAASHSGRCLNVYQAGAHNGAQLIQWDCTGAPNSLWYIEPVGNAFRLRAKHSGKCLDVTGVSDQNDARLQQWDCLGTNNQLFTFNHPFIPANQPARLVSASNSSCLGITESSVADGAVASRTACSNTAPASNSQGIRLERKGTGYRLVAQHSNKCLGTVNGSLAQDAAIVQWGCFETPVQVWTVVPSGNFFQFVNQNSGLCATTQANGQIVQRTCAATNDFLWTISVKHSLGSWSPVVTLPLVPVAAAMMRNNQVVFWSAYDAYTFGNDNGRTQTALWNPATNAVASYLVANTGHDMFCPGTSLLPDGRLLVNGGSSSAKTSIFNPVTNDWSVAAPMLIPRGYQANTVLDNGQVFTIGGSWSGGIGGKNGEVWSASTGWTLRSGIPATAIQGPDPEGAFRGDNHAWLFSGAGGKVFHAGPSAQMNWFTTVGAGTTTSAGNRSDDAYAMNGNAVLFDVGKILKVGGAPAYQNASATGSAYLININAAVAVTKLAPMAYNRAFHNSVVLPDGRVFVVGGQATPLPFKDNVPAMTPEVWNATSLTFSPLAPMTVPRTYHSIALLLPDARVLVGGGGLCGGCGENHPNLEIYSPSYLFQPNGNSAVRPSISNGPAAITVGTQFNVTTTSAVSKFVLVRLSAATHSVNNDQRRVPLTISATNGLTYTLSAPANTGVATAGYWMLFALNASNTPSTAAIVQVN